MNDKQKKLLAKILTCGLNQTDIDKVFDHYAKEYGSKETRKSKVLEIVRGGMAEGVDMVAIEQIIAEGMEIGLTEIEVKNELNELELDGDIYKPRHHFYKLTRIG